jgi:hypothetical protein
MSLVDSVMDNIEAKILNSVQDRLEILTELDSDTLVLTTKTHWDGKLISLNTIDMSPLALEIIKRVKEDAT